MIYEWNKNDDFHNSFFFIRQKISYAAHHVLEAPDNKQLCCRLFKNDKLFN